MIASIISITYYLYNNIDNSVELLTQKNYFQSYQLKDDTTNYISDLSKIMHIYKSKENIEEGHTVYYNVYDLPYSVRDQYKAYKEDVIQKKPTLTEKEIIDAFAQDNYVLLRDSLQKGINTDLNDYLNIINGLEANGVKYYIEYEGKTLTNVKDKDKSYFQSQDVFFTFDEEGPQTSFDEFRLHLYDLLELKYLPQEKLYITYDNKVLASKAQQWKLELGKFKPSMTVVVVLGVLSFIGILYLGTQYDESYFPWINFFLPLDLLFIINITIITMSLLFSFEYYKIMGQYLTIPVTLLSGMIIINFYLRVIKPEDKPYYKRFLLYYIGVLPLKWIGTFFTKLPTIFRMQPTPYKAKDLNAIIKGLDIIKNGDSDHIITTKSKGIYKDLAENINTISDGLRTAVDNKVKSERMKSELITNVSHDIRTPLTSIITYIDLIKRTENLEERAKYFEIIEQKSLRLKTLTDSLFEAAKVNSGNVEVTLEPVDVQFLLSQAFAELSDKITNSDLDFITNYRHQTKLIKADGKLMFRVIENLISNILKYAQEKSRVYISIEEQENHLQLIFKNISAEQLNMAPEEFFERFSRGESSRTTEGNGLGLSIARQLMELQGGSSEITIDGDLFKVTLTIRKIHQDEHVNN